MSLIGRFTRDSASKYVWAGLMLLAIGGLVLAIIWSDRAITEQRSLAQDRAVAYVEDVVDPQLDAADVQQPIPADGELGAAVERSVLSDVRVARVRVWARDGALLFSTDEQDRLGSHAGLNDALLREASSFGTITRSDVSDTGGSRDPERSLLRTYVPLGETAIAEIDQTDAGTVAAVRSEWFRYQVLAGVVVALLLYLTALSLRDPIERINTGVSFASSSIPAGYTLIDTERLQAVEEVYRLSTTRVARLEERLLESEEARRRVEGDLQRALSEAATKSTAPPPAATSTPAPPVQVEPPAPPVVQVPESPVVPSTSDDRWAAAAPAGPLARAARDQKPAPSTTSGPASPAVAPEPEPKKRPRLRKTKPAAEEPVRVPEAQPQEPEPNKPARRAVPVPERKVAAVVAAHAKVATPAPMDPVADAEAKAHEAALETFIRLTESDRRPHDTTEVDQGAVRAALARTAARKKPGGGERMHPREEEHEGGPPPRNR